MTIRDLTYRLFCFDFCYCCLLRCGDERRTCVLQKRPITQLTCVFAASVQLPPPFCLVQCSSSSVTHPRLQKYDTVSPFFSLMQPWMARDSKSLEKTFLQFINLVQHCRRNTFESLVCHICVARHRLPSLICLSNQIKKIDSDVVFNSRNLSLAS